MHQCGTSDFSNSICAEANVSNPGSWCRKVTLSGDHSHLGTGHVGAACPLSGAGLGLDPESGLLSSRFFGSP